MWRFGFWVCVSVFLFYCFMMLVAPIICGWNGDGEVPLCKVLPAPVRVVLLSEFVFVEVVGVCLVIGGALAILSD